MEFETTHELAKYLLSKQDCPVRHHYHYQENFWDYGLDFVNKIAIIEKDGNVYITEGDITEEGW